MKKKTFLIHEFNFGIRDSMSHPDLVITEQPAIFSRDEVADLWIPSPLAAGPFAGLQGGSFAGLMTVEVEVAGHRAGWGQAMSATAKFLRPTPLVPLRSQVTVLSAGGRVWVIDSTIWPQGATEPSATVRVTFVRPRSIEIPGFMPPEQPVADPLLYPRTERRAPHGGPWFMVAMEVRMAPDITWFRLKAKIASGAGALAQVLGPADWTHGLGRPVNGVVADPNANLTVQLLRPPVGEWIGIKPLVRWDAQTALWIGSGVLLDVLGDIGVVSMAVALTPFPKIATVVSVPLTETSAPPK